MIKKKNLSLFYAFHQFIFWMIPGGVAGFAATYLLDNGFSNFEIGMILFFGCFFSFLFQPILGQFADKASRNVLPYLMCGLSILSALMFSSIYLFNLSVIAFAAVYMLGNVFVDMQNPLLNSISMYYSLRKWRVNYAIGRGIGAMGFGIATLLFGKLIDSFGTNIMLVICIGLMIIYGIMSLFYPKDTSRIETYVINEETTSSIFKFMKKYKWYSLSLVLFMLFAVFHVMVENFLIQIMSSLGGSSSQVGTALFLATLVEIPTTVLFGKIYKKLGSKKIIYIGGLFYVLKGIILLFASSIGIIYVAQLLQGLNYVMINTIEMYYAKECTSSVDMVKSQSLITAFFSLGCAIGNITGGTLLEILGIMPMLLIGLFIAILGVLTSLFTVRKALAYGKAMTNN